MATGQWSVVLRHVQRLFHGGSVSGLSEGQLLDRFVSSRDEVAFGAIVARHGPMVLGVCRGVLDDPHDVEDAFQATFLILVKKAALVRDRDLLGQWLYGVARRVSLRARAETSKRRAKERPEAEATEPVATLDDELRELQVLIREEVDRLSNNDRMAVVLCYLEGLTHEEAADRLGWPVGTVKGRLSRAREKLRARLTRRGVALPAAALASTLTRGASAAVPLELLRSTTLAASRLAAGKTLAAGIVSAQAIHLMEGVLGTMFTTKLKLGAMALVATCAVAVHGVLAFQGQGPAGEVGKTPRPGLRKSSDLPANKGLPAVEKGQSKDDAAREEQARLAEQALDELERMIAHGQGRRTSEYFYVWSRRLAEAKASPDVPEAERKAALQIVRDLMRKRVEYAEQAAKSGNGSYVDAVDALEAKYHLIEADRWLRNGKITDIADRQPTGMGGGPAGGFAGGGGFGGGIGPRVGVSPIVDGGILTLNQTPADEKRNDAIRAKLEEKISMNFANPTPFEDVKKYIQQSTQDEAAGFPTGLPIYVDPDGLKEASDLDAEITMASTVTMNLEGTPLRTTLRLALRQLGLDYRIDGGVVFISDIHTIVVQDLKEKRFRSSQ
jgi:RNA polymerase sigma factor (sigma-70 family)